MSALEFVASEKNACRYAVTLKAVAAVVLYMFSRG